MLNKDLVDYIEKNIFIKYERFYAHGMLHINNVIKNMLMLADYYNLDKDLNENTTLKNIEYKAREWCNLKGTFNAYNYNDFYLNIYTVNNSDYYISDVKITKINRDSSYASNYKDKIKDLASNEDMMYGTMAYKDALYDENYNQYLSSHFNLYSCGNYLFLDELK